MKTKRTLKTVLIALLMVCFALGMLFALTACTFTTGDAVGAAGKDGVTPHIGSDGYWYFGSEKTSYKATGANGKDGEDGADGVTPSIGEDGYWYFGDEKTDYKAVGADGQNGKDGKDGVTPHIGEDGYWYFGTEKTDYKAVGADGQDGQNGTNGKDGVTPHIGEDGYWYFGDEKTDYKAVGADGQNGTNGKDGANGKSAYELYLKQYKEDNGSEDGAMSEEEWLKSLKQGNVWQTGEGTPYALYPNPEDGMFYLDTSTGNFWQAKMSDDAVTWTRLFSTNSREIDHIDNHVQNGTEPEWGIKIHFKDGSTVFLKTACMHKTDIRRNLYSDDCTVGTISVSTCSVCNAEVLLITKPSAAAKHRYESTWSHDTEYHWHQILCSHTEFADVYKFEHDWTIYYTLSVKDGHIQPDKYVEWHECLTCGYKFEVPTKDDITNEDGYIHIANANDWNRVATVLNNSDDTSDVKIKIDNDIDFNGMVLTPICIPINAAEMVTKDDYGFAYDTQKPVEGAFKGEFDGNGKKLSNFVLQGKNFVGLFGALDGATVKNFTIEDATVKGDAFVGTVAGFITGDKVCISDVKVIDTTLDDTKNIIANRHAGGIAGFAYKAGTAYTNTNDVTNGATAAIKNCSVTSEIPSRPAAKYFIDMQFDKFVRGISYENSGNGGGILGTSIGSSVIGCSVSLQIRGWFYISYLVGYVEGTAERKAVIAYSTYDENGMRNSQPITEAGEKNKSSVFGAASSGDIIGHGKTPANVINKENGQAAVAAAISLFSQNVPNAVGGRVLIGSFEDLQNFQRRVDGYVDEDKEINIPAESFVNARIYLTDNIVCEEDQIWDPIDKFDPENSPLNNATFDGGGFTISNLHTTNDKTATYPYGVGMFGVLTGTFTIQNVTFDDAHMHFRTEEYYGNVIGVVVGYAYGNVTFNNVSVTNSYVWGFGKVGTLLGMGADPGVHITFKNCTSTNNTLHGAYNLGGFAGNIQRSADGKDNTTIDNTNSSSNNHYDLEYTDYTLDGIAKFTANDGKPVDDQTIDQAIKGHYTLLPDYASIYFGGYADYYISYGKSAYDAPYSGSISHLEGDETVTVQGTGEIADSEICVDLPKAFRDDTAA